MSLKTNFYGFKGYIELAKDKYDAAERDLTKAYKLGLEKPAYLIAYGTLLMQKGDYALCKEVYEKAYEGLGVNVMYYNAIKSSIITCDYKLGNIEQSLKDAEEMFNEMKNGTTYVIYGYILMMQGMLEKALEINREAFDYDPDDVAICDNLAQTYYRLGDIENAKIYFQKALEIKRNMIDSCYYLALIYIDEGKIDEAFELLDDAHDSKFSALTTVTPEELNKKYEELKNLTENN